MTLDRAVAAALGLLLCWMVAAPLVLVLLSAVRPGGFPLDPGFTTANFASVYLAPGFPDLLGTTLAFAAGSTAVALVLGTLLAWAIERTDLPGAGLFRALVILPMATPPVLLAIGWTLLASPRIGVLNRVLQDALGLAAAPFDVFSLGGMIFVEGLSLVPTTVLMLAPACRNMDPSFEEAALASGASRLRVLGRIVLPLLLPAIAAAACFMLIVSLVVFDVPGTLGLPVRRFVLSTQVFHWISESPGGVPEYGKVGALAVLFLAILLALGALYRRATRRAAAFRTVGGKGVPRPAHAARAAALAGVRARFGLLRGGRAAAARRPRLVEPHALPGRPVPRGAGAAHAREPPRLPRQRPGGGGGGELGADRARRRNRRRRLGRPRVPGSSSAAACRGAPCSMHWPSRRSRCRAS